MAFCKSFYCSYSKQEGKIEDYTPFTHLLTDIRDVDGYDVIHTENGFDYLNWKYLVQNWKEVVRDWQNFTLDKVIVTSPRVYVQKRKDIPLPPSKWREEEEARKEQERQANERKKEEEEKEEL